MKKETEVKTFAPDDLVNAPELARVLGVDLKTLHNWVNKGEIKHFRTPGRHLRFQWKNVVEFMNSFGFPVPGE